MTGNAIEPTTDEVLTGAAVYSRRPILAAYDLWVLGFVCSNVWRCPNVNMRRLYDRNVDVRHLDLGPGTGFFLDKARFPAPNPELVLLDLNEDALKRTAARLSRHRPKAYRRDVLKPLDLGSARFGSVGLNFLLHCMPGGMAHKAAVFDTVAPYVEPGGRIFGSTVLAHGVQHSRMAPKALESLNGDGVMNNLDDSFDQLDAELKARFSRYRLWSKGSVGLFEITVV